MAAYVLQARGVYADYEGASRNFGDCRLSVLSGLEVALRAHWAAMVQGSRGVLTVWLFLALLTVGEGISEWD